MQNILCECMADGLARSLRLMALEQVRAGGAGLGCIPPYFPLHISLPRPMSCKIAIDKGLVFFQAKQFQEAVDMFNVALELPGNGAYRLAGSVREFRWEGGGVGGG